MVPHDYISTIPAGFDWQNVPARSIVFYEKQEAEIPPPPAEFDHSAVYSNHNQGVIGFAWTNTDVNIKSEVSFSNAYVKNPGFNAILYSALAIIALALIPLRIRVITEKMTDEAGLRIHTEITLWKPGKKSEE
jgi:hypothetical protein